MFQDLSDLKSGVELNRGAARELRLEYTGGLFKEGPCVFLRQVGSQVCKLSLQNTFGACIVHDGPELGPSEPPASAF